MSEITQYIPTKHKKREYTEKQQSFLDNLVKAVLDAFFEEDKQIYDVRGQKFWKVKGSILISEIYD